MTPDKRIAWLREHVPAFKDANSKAEAALRDTEENRKLMSPYMSAANLARHPQNTTGRGETNG